MATSDNYFTQYLEDETNKERFNDSLENSTFLDLIDQKREDLGLKAEQKKLDFVNQTINLEEGGFDADTLNLFGRLASQPGFSFDAYETAHYDENNELIPYLGKIAPIDGSKRSKKWNLHRSALAKKLGIPRDYVTQGMLNEEAAKQAQNFKDLLYKGQDPDSPTVSVDIRQDGVGFFGRPLITVRNPITGDIINEVMNTPENNAMFYSKYNKEAYAEGVLQLADAERAYNKNIGQGFWDSMGKGLSSGIDNLQATGYGFMALIVDATGNEQLGTWFLDQYLRNLNEAQANGANLPGIEDIDWSNPTQVLSKLGALIGEAMPSIALMIGTGGLGGLLAKQAVKGGVKKLVNQKLGTKAAELLSKAQRIGRNVGAYGSAMGMETGSIYGDVGSAGHRDWKAIAGSLAGGTIAGALEAFYPLKLMKKFGLTRAANKAAKKSFLSAGFGQSLKTIGKELLAGGLTEGSTEGMQFIVEEVTQDLIKEGHLPDYKSEEFKLGLLNSIVAGLVPGATFSGTASTVSQINQAIGGDARVTQQEVNRVKQKAQQAKDDEAVGEPDIQSVENVANNINEVENDAKNLGIDLNNELYKKGSNTDKASYILNALSELEVDQRKLPKNERKPEIVKARKNLEKALKNLNSGNIADRNIAQQAVAQAKLRRKLKAAGKNQDLIKAARQEYSATIALINAKDIRYTEKKSEVLVEEIDTEIKEINSINEQLKDPNLSKAKIKNLKRLRNQLGVKIDKLSKDKEGTKIAQLDKSVFANIDKALASFEFKNKKSNLREDTSISEDIQEVAKDDNLEKIGANTIKVLENVKSTNEQRANAINAFSKIYNKAKSIKSRIEKELETVTDPKERKALKAALKDINKRLDNVSKTIEVLAKEGSTVKATEVLYSLSPLTEKQIEELKKLEGLSKTEQALLDAHIAVYEAKKEVDENNKDIDDVRNDVLLGEKVFQGFMHYLKLAQKKSSSAISNIKDFLNILNDKLSRFEDAQEILKNENLTTVWISKNNYQDPILRTMPTVEKDGKQVEDKDNYFFVNAKSVRLMQSIKEEIAFGKAVLALIIKATSRATTKEKAALDEATKEAEESQVKKPVTDKDLDDIKTENVKIDTTKPIEPETTDEGLKGTQLNLEILSSFKGAKDAAIKLANDKNQTKYVRMIAKLIIPLLSDDIKISTDFDLYGDHGIHSHFYHGEVNPVAVVMNPADSTTVLLHELIHAATQTILETSAKDRTARQNNAVKQLYKVRENIIKQYEKDIASGDITADEKHAIEYLLYGAAERVTELQLKVRRRMGMKGEALHESELLGEFLTQVLTSVEAQSYLKRKKVSNKKQKTLWNEVVTAVRNLLNIKDSEVDSLLDEALAATIETIESLVEPTIEKEKPQDSTEQSAEDKSYKTAQQQAKSKVKHFINKYGGLALQFLKLYRTKLKGSDIFKIAQPKRKSFYSKYDSWDPGIDVLLEEYLGESFEDKEFIKYLHKYFYEFKNSFEKHNRKVKQNKKTGEAFHSQEFLQLLFVEIDGVKTLPDEVIFAMMLSTLQYMSINNFNTEVSTEQQIGLLLYNDMQADLSRQELMDFGNMGVLFKDAASEIGNEAFNNLNLKIDSSQLKGDSINEVISNIESFIAENGDGLLPSDLIAQQVKIALGGTALAVATSVHSNKGKNNSLDGLIEIVYTTYYHETFEGEPTKGLKENDYRKGMPTRLMKTIKFPYLQMKKVPFGLEKLFESIKNNKETIDIINNTDSELSGPLAKPRKVVQKFVRGSFIKIPEKTRDVMKALHKVPWLGKKKALDLWNMTDESTRERVVGIVDLEEKHVTERPGFETSNQDKLKDIKLVDAYDGKPFWFKYSAQKQNRINIDSNGINGQRSKIHRSFFMPKSSNVLIDNEFKRAMYQLGIAQAFGYGIDKNTLQDSLLAFDKLYEQSRDIVEYLKSDNVKEEQYNKLLNELLDKEGIDASAHVIEAIASLTSYRPTGSFKSESLGIETDGITNGYAIAQLQLLGIPQEILDTGTDEEIITALVASLARIGVFVEPGMTMEKFIREGNLDVYQTLAFVIKDTLAQESALETINTERKENVREITKEQIAALDIVHGEIWTEEDNEGILTREITKFGRNLAKNPLMISGYGAEIARIISALAADAIPTINNKLAEFQVEYNNAKTTREKAEVLKRFTVYAKALNNFIPGSYVKNKEGKVTGLTVQLKKGNLKRIVFTDVKVRNLEKAYEAIFTPALTTALEQFTIPLKKARDAIIQSGEWQYTTFMFYFDQAIEDYKQTKAYKNSPSKLVPAEIEAEIADTLALKYMPLIYGEWSDPDTPLQIIKTARIAGNQDIGRVVIPVPRKVFPMILKNGFKFEAIRDKKGNIITDDTYSLDSHSDTRQYVTPGVSTYTNYIQNADSVLIGKLILKNPNVLTIFDAAMSDIATAYDNNNNYNEGFRDSALTYSILETALARLTDVKFAIMPGDLKAIEKIYREGKEDKDGNIIYKPSFEAQGLLDAMEEISDTTELQAQYDALSFKVLEDTFNEEIKRVKDMRNLLNKAFGTKDKDGKLIKDSWLKNAIISQMYLAESLKLIKDKKATIEDIKAGANIDIEAETVTEPEEEIAESQVDPEDTTTEIEEETQKAEPGELTKEEATEGDPFVLFQDDKGNDVFTNAGQTNAINKMKEWWQSTDKMFVLAGRGGTGKTTIVDKALDELKVNKNGVVMALPTHKALQVIEEATQGSAGDYMTIASLLGLEKKFNDKTGEFFFKQNVDKYAKTLRNLDNQGVNLIVIDEVSMVTEEQATQLVELTKSKTEGGLNLKIIFMGDNVQLPPIEDSDSKIGLSVVFDNVMGFNNKADLGINPDNYVKLTKRMRQGEESPILGITDILANTIEWIFQNPTLYTDRDSGFILPKVPENNKHEGVHYMKGTVREGLTDETLDKFVEEYKKDPANVKYIHYNKESKSRTISIRSRIRKKLFPNVANSGNLKALPFIKSERIVIGESAAIMKDNKAVRSTELTNGQEVTVTAELINATVTAQTSGDFAKYFYDVPVRILQVKDDNNIAYSLVFEHDKTDESIKRQLSPAAKWSSKKKVIPEITTSEIAAAYLINSHKSQGSTYKTVYADYENIMGPIGPPDWLAKMQSLYVATSRPSERLVLVGTGDLAFGQEGKDLNENIEILKNLENNEESSPRDSEELYSLDNDLDIEMKALWDTDSVANTAQNIFNKLGNHFRTYYPTKEEQSTQESHLQRVLDEIILPTGNALDNVSVELFTADVKAFGAVSLQNKNISVVLNNKKPKSFSEQTAQEAYLHELIHILTNSPLAKNSSFRNDIERIRNSVKKELEKMDRPYEIFLHKDIDGNIITLTDAKTEIAAAKKQYNYLFGPKKSEFILDEFLAYSLTNKHLVRELGKMPANVVPLWNKESDAHVLEKIIDFFTELVKRFVNIMQKKPASGTLDNQIFQITKEMVNASHSQAGRVRAILQRQNFAKDYDKANEATSVFLKDMVSKGVKFGSDQYIKGVDKLTKDGKINNFLANVLYDSKLAVLMTSSYGKFINKNPKVQRYLDAAFKNFKPGLKQNMASLKADAFGGINEDFIRLLYKSQKEVDTARRQYKELTRDSLLNEFQDLESLTQEEKEAITRVLFKSDFSVLIATDTFSMKDAIKLLNDDTYLDEQIAEYADKLDIKNNNHYAAQTKALAKWMMEGNQFNHNQVKNAHLIHMKNPGKSKATVKEIDVYVTLLAMRNHVEPRTKNQIKTVVNREFKANKDHNGITNTIYHHIAFKENTLKDNFDGNPILTSKGYIADITNPNIQIEFAATDAETQKLMEEADYEYVSGFETITGVNDSQYGIYVNRNLPDAMRTKGIASVTSKHFAGSSFKEIMSRNPATEGQINLLLKRFTKNQTDKQNTLDKNHTMMPLHNEKGEIVDYTIHMNHVFKEQILEQELSFDQVLPTMYSHALDKVSSEKINREAIDLLDTHTTLNYDKAPQKYVNILEGENRDEYFNVLPRDARNHILDLAKKNKDKKLTFYVERKLLDTVFGYKMPSVGNAPIIRSNKKIQRHVKVAEKMMFELVALAKVNIVIKIPAVLGFNIVSNFMTSLIYGIPPAYLIKKWREGFKELERYQKEHKKLQLLELKQIGNPALRNDPKIENDKKIITKSLNNNKVAKLIDMGLFNSITEDINRNDFTYRHQTMNTLRRTKIGRKFDNKFKGNVVKLANQAYVGEETALFKTMMHLTQASDFIARYAMYSHTTEVKNMDKDKAFKQMVETFVNYDQPLNRYLQYGNDIGLLFFVKYWLRIQRATFNIAKEKPLNIGMLYIGNTMLGLDIESIMESSVLVGNFFPTAGGPLKVFDEVLMFPGLEILSGESLGIG